MRVVLVFPDPPRAAFATAIGWMNALASDPDVQQLHLCHTRGYFDLRQDIALDDLLNLPGEVTYDLALVVWGRQVFARAPEGRTLGARQRGLILTDEPYETPETVTFNATMMYDIVGVNDAATVDRHRQGIELLCAWDPALRPVGASPGDAPRFDVGWVGGTDRRRRAWLRRLDWANRGASWLWVGPRIRPWFAASGRSRVERVSYRAEPGKGFYTPAECLGFYHQCRMVVNLHRADGPGPPAQSPNPRLYELMGHGIPAVHDSRTQMPPECLRFSHPAEMGRYLRAIRGGSAEAMTRLNAAVEVGRIAAANHTYAQRWATLRLSLPKA